MSTTDAGSGAAERGPIAWFARNPVAANLLLLFLIIGGMIAGRHLAVQLYPYFDLRAITVTVPAPGSSPKEVEEDINRRIEEAIVGLRGVKRVVGTATEGRGQLRVELETFADPDTVLNDVQNAVDGIENFPPLNAERPEVELHRFAIEVLTLAVSSSHASENELRLAAENARDELLALSSVSQVTLLGTRDREITIELSEEELRRHNLSIAQISRIVRRASLNLTFGELRTDAGGVVLQTITKRRTGDEFKDIPLITRLGGAIVTLGDVATIRDGFVDEEIVSEVNGQSTVFVRVDAVEQESVVEIGEEIKLWLADHRAPGNITVSIWNDRAAPALDRLQEIIRNGILGALLVFLTLVLVFDLRVATWITIGIPMSFIGSLIFFGAADMTLNIGTIFAFFLLIGIVVDDSVVVGESIAAERESGKSAADAAISGARAMVGPITVGAATTMLAFVPLLFVTSGGYQLTTVFPYVALFVLLVSLVESFFVLPAHLSHDRPWSLSPLSDIQGRVDGLIDRTRDYVVAPSVARAVQHPWLTLAIGAVVVLIGVLLLRSDNVRVVIIDQDALASDSIQADLHLPAGTPFEQTLAAAERFAAAARSINDQLDGTSIKSVAITAGNQSAVRTADIRANRSNIASVRIHLNPRPARTASPRDIERAWRRNVGDTSELESVEFQSTRVKSNPPVSYALKHPDTDVLRTAATELKASLATVPGVFGISDSLSAGKRHFEIQLTRAGKAAGLTPAGIGAQLRASFHGVEVQRIQRGREEVKVVVRYPAERRQSLGDLASERIHRPAGGNGRRGRDRGASGGGEVPLSTVATLTEKRELTTLTRIDGKQAAFVDARTDAVVTTPRQARREVRERIIPGLLAKYPGLKVEPDGAAREERELLGTLGLLVPIVLLAMYALMAAFLRSYWKPLVAVVGIPISFAGAVLTHWILGWDFAAMSLFGIVAVGGIIVNDALVLLDRYNYLRRESDMIPAIAAASAATRHRFRAVLLTSLTTVVGLSPLLYERSDELIFLVPFVVSMLGGLVLSTIFILFLLPALVMIVDGRYE